MSIVRAAKKFKTLNQFFGGLVGWFFFNINFQAIFGHIIEHEVNYLFTRTPLMCGSHCRGCNVCPAPLLGGRGERVPALTILKWPPAVGQNSGPFHGGSSMNVHQRGQREPAEMGNSLTQREILAPFVTKGGSPVRNASHKLEI